MSEKKMEWHIRDSKEQIGPGSIVMDDWILGQSLGHGGFGSVWLADKNVLGVSDQSAIKIIRIPRDPADISAMRAEGCSDENIQAELRQSAEKAVQEIRAMIDLRNHPAIVPCEGFDVIQYDDDGTWEIDIRMQLLTSLSDWANSKEVKPEDAVRMGISLTDLLTVCESKHIMHRDIKPANIFVDQLENFKLGDFGLARVISDAKSIHSKGVGAEAFMAPEVFRGEQYDHRADIYSLGLVMYWLLNGQSLPFTGKGVTRSQAISRRLSGEALPVLPGVDSVLDQIIRKACDPDPKKRWQTAREFHKALESKPGDPPPGKPWLKIISMIAVLALLIGGYVFFTNSSRSRNNEVSKPSFILQPSASAVPAGGTATFNVAATGENLTYQWYYQKPGDSDWLAVINNGQSAVYSFNTEEQHDGYLYRCMVTDDSGESVYSEPAKLTLTAKPVITSNPSAVTAVEGDTVTFRVTATGTSLSFQWYYQKPGASDWSSVASNGQSAVLSFNTDTRHDGYLYRCVVTDNSGESVYSEPAKLTLIAKPVITSNPSAVTAAEGDTVTFSITATGTDLSFQWYYQKPGASDWSPVTNNGRSAVYSFKTDTRHDCYIYRCMVTNRAGSVYSEPAKLTLIAKPVITSNPSAASAAEGDTVTFRVTATGTSLSFQWYYKTPDASDWTAVINNGQSAVYTFNTKKRHDGYLYRCMVTNSAGSVYSEPAKFTLITMPVITSNPSAVSAAEGNTVTFRVTATGTNLSFQWYYKTPNASDWSAVINNGQSAEYSFNAEKRHDGYLYRCMIANSAGSVYSEPAKFTLIAKPVITESPSQVSVTTGKTATFRVTATGTDLSFQWYYKKPGDTEWTAVSSHGTSDNYSLLATTQYNGYAYCCKVTNGAGDSEWSNSAKLTVYTKSVITESPSQVSVTAGNTATFSVTATETDLTYQWYYKRPGDTEWVSAGSKGTSDFYSFTATTQYNGYAYCCKVTNGAGDSEWSSSAKLAVYAKPVITSLLSPVSVTAGKTATFRVTATGTGLTYQWYYKRPGGTEWVSAGSKGTSDSYSFTATTQYNGYAYCCKVTNGAGDSEWCSSAKLAVYAKPVITESPSQVSVTAGNTSTFRVTAAGTDLTYQWYYKRPGDTEWVSAGSKGTSDSYSFTATTQYNGYAYCCKVTNGAGDSEWSSSAKLAVYAKPVITSSFSPVSVTAGKTATFSVTAAGTGLTYQWYYKRPGGTEWVSAGSKGTSDSYSFTATTQYNGYAYCCKVTNGAGDSEWSSSAKLTVSTNSGTTTNSSSTSTAFTVAKNVPTLSSLYNKVDTQLSGRKTSWYYHYGPGTDYLPDEMAYKVDSEHSNKVYAYFLENGWIFAFVQYSTTTSKFVYLESGAIDSTYGLLNFSSASYFEGTVTKETIPYFSPTDKSKQEGKYKISAGTKVKVFFQENNRAYAEFTHENRKVRLWIPMENISNLVYKQ